jgi:uncharacterized repeat protein (TIGR03806 family)
MNLNSVPKSAFFCIVLVAAMAGLSAKRTQLAPKLHLSEYGFFNGRLADLQPANRVFFYEVNAPLFTDYAEKSRFVYLPEGSKLGYQSTLAFDFPEGAIIIKNFFYALEVSSPQKGRKILETRLLIREKNNWKALTYIWNEDQSDADAEVAGATLPVSWADASGSRHTLDYTVPNVNQCKGCHSYDGQFTPIGVTTRQLNKTVAGKNQLLAMHEKGILDLPEGFTPGTAPALAEYLKTNLQEQDKVALAARAYLDGNCSHCHNAHGPASTSGMFLGADESDPERLGVGKPPVAAGRGSGKRKFGIVPGKPDQSILVYRMESNDPGIRMPELGRQLAHKEGLDIIKAWIKGM